MTVSKSHLIRIDDSTKQLLDKHRVRHGKTLSYNSTIKLLLSDVKLFNRYKLVVGLLESADRDWSWDSKLSEICKPK